MDSLFSFHLFCVSVALLLFVSGLGTVLQISTNVLDLRLPPFLSLFLFLSLLPPLSCMLLHCISAKVICLLTVA